MRFVLAVIKGNLIVNNRKKDELLLELQKKGFKAFSPQDKTNQPADDDASVSTENSDEVPSLDKGYDYLLSMKIWSLTMEKVQELINQRDAKRSELDLLQSKTAEMLWLDDLDSLEAALSNYEGEIEAGKRQEIAARKKARNDKAAKSKNASSYRAKGKAARKNASGSEDDDDIDDEDMSDFEEAAKKKRKPPTVKSTAVASVKQPVAIVPTASSSSSSSSSSVQATLPKAPSEPKTITALQSSKPEKAEKVVKEKKPRAKPVKAPKEATVANKPITKFFKKKSAKDDDDDEVEDDDDESVVDFEDEPIAKPISRAPRAAAIVAKTKASSLYKMDSDGDDNSAEEEPSFAFDESDSDELSEDFDHSDIKAIKAKAKQPRATKAKSVAAIPSLLTVSMSMPTASAPKKAAGKTKGVKRGAQIKGSDAEEDADAEMEPPSPKAQPVKKKLKKATSSLMDDSASSSIAPSSPLKRKLTKVQQKFTLKKFEPPMIEKISSFCVNILGS